MKSFGPGLHPAGDSTGSFLSLNCAGFLQQTPTPSRAESEAGRACSSIPPEGSGEAKAAHGGSHAPPKAWVPPGHLRENTNPGRTVWKTDWTPSGKKKAH